MTYILLLCSIVLSTGRNLLSKCLSATTFGTKPFFYRQSILFSFGLLALVIFGDLSWRIPSLQTLVYAIIYATFLILAQWFYTVSLANGNTALCSTIYSMGFILPTVLGAVLWSEPFLAFDLIGVLCAVIAILCAGDHQKRTPTVRKRSFFSLLIATFSSGGLGIMQKLQQKSQVADEKSEFLLIAFLLAAIISLISSLFAQSDLHSAPQKHSFAIAAGVGIAFGCCNLLNTALAGKLPGVIFFPTLNIGVILLTTLCSCIFLKEQIRKKEILVLTFGGISVLLLNAF